MRLAKGTITEVKRERGSWFEKAWAYSHKGVLLGYLYKQLYPGVDMPIYRFQVMVSFLPCHWKKVPKETIGYTSEHYSKFSVARKAMKKAILTHIKFLNSCLHQG